MLFSFVSLTDLIIDYITCGNGEETRFTVMTRLPGRKSKGSGITAGKVDFSCLTSF
jgi:hypothetical protein